MKKLLAAFAAGALACAFALAPLAIANHASAQTVYGSQGLESADANAAAAAAGDQVSYTQLTAPTRTAAPIDGEVTVPWGEWLGALIDAAYALILGFLLWLLRKVPKNIVDMVNAIAQALGQGGVNELLGKAVDYGINVTQGAVRDQKMTIKVGNEVLERATEYALRHAPGLVAKYGGLATLREKIIARLNLDGEAGVPAPRPPVDSLIQGAES